MIPFSIQSYQSRSLPVSAQRLVNFYPEPQLQGAASPVVLHSTPGLSLFATASGEVHGMHVMNDVLYVVAGTSLYKITASGTATNLGTVAGNKRCSMANNGTQLCIVNGVNGYIYDGTLSAIADSDFMPADTVTFLDGYFIFNEAGSGRFFISAINDGETYDALDYATAESAPDDTIAVIADHREIWLGGEHSIEVWFDSGNADFPFERNNGALIERGLAAKHSMVKADNTVFWLGDDKLVYRANGYTPQRISHYGVETAISGYSRIDDAFAYTYSDNGHTFYVLTFPTDKKTWVYDASNNWWHEREDYLTTRHRSNCYAYCYGKHLVGDFENGRLYEMSQDVYSDNGNEIIRQANSAVIHGNGERLFMPKFEMFMETGVGLTGGTEPQAMLQWSDDGGKTWSNEHWAGMGAIGEYGKRIVWNRLGSFRQRVMRLTVSDPVKTVTIGAQA